MADELKSIIMCVRVTPQLYASLREVSRLDRRTLSQMVRVLLEDALQAREQETTDDNNGGTSLRQ